MSAMISLPLPVCRYAVVSSVLSIIALFVVFAMLTIWGMLCLLLVQCSIVRAAPGIDRYVLMKLPMKCGTTTLGWFITPLVGLGAVVVITATMMLLVRRFPNQARRLADACRLPARTANHWRNLESKGFCEICYDDDVVLGTLCVTEQHQLCRDCARQWTQSCVGAVTCPFCRQTSDV